MSNQRVDEIPGFVILYLANAQSVTLPIDCQPMTYSQWKRQPGNGNLQIGYDPTEFGFYPVYNLTNSENGPFGVFIPADASVRDVFAWLRQKFGFVRLIPDGDVQSEPLTDDETLFSSAMFDGALLLGC